MPWAWSGDGSDGNWQLSESINDADKTANYRAIGRKEVVDPLSLFFGPTVYVGFKFSP